MKTKNLLVAFLIIFAMGCKKEQKEPDYYNFHLTEAEMSTGQTEFTVPPTTTASVVQLQSNMWWNLTITYPDPKAAGWLSITPSKGRGSIILELTLEENFHSYARSAVIQLKPDADSDYSGYSFTFTQQAAPRFITFSGDEITNDVLNIGLVNGVADVNIHSNVAWTVSYSDASPWYQLSVASGGGDDVKNSLTAEYTLNNTGVIREGKMTFSDGAGYTKILTVKQKEVFDQSELTVDNGMALVANWTQVIGTDTYELRFLDASDVEIPNSAIKGLDKTTFTYDLSNHFSSISPAYAGIIKVTVVANTVDPSVSSESEPILSHTHFANGSGDGSVGGEFLLTNWRHLKNINATAVTLSKNYKQIVDFDFTGQTVSTFTPIGRLANQSFTGTYSGAKEGGGVYKIKNAAFEINDESRYFWGIFGYVGSGASVGDLEFENCQLDMTICAASGAGPTGFAHAVAVNTGGLVHHITLNNCVIRLNKFQRGVAIGGVVGRLNSPDADHPGKITYCTTTGGSIAYTEAITDAATQNGNQGYDVGGIAGIGQAFSVIENCGNNSTPVSARARAAGIVSNNCSVIKSYNHAPIESGVNSGGGIQALINGGGPFVIQDCYNTGAITYARGGAAAYVGGILGRGNIAPGVKIERCFNSGNVISIENQRPSMFGGIAGDFSNIGSIINCFNTGDVDFSCLNATAAVNYAGGIIGNATNQATVIANCYNTGKVSGTSVIAGSMRTGLVGNRAGTNIIVNNCYYLAGTAVVNDIAVGGNATGVTDCVSKSSADLKDPSKYDSSWDFTTIWAAPSGTFAYPQLQGLPYKPATP